MVGNTHPFAQLEIHMQQMMKRFSYAGLVALAVWLVPATASATCECSGTGIDGPVTVACGGIVCGTDSMSYSCSASGFSPTGQSCTSSCSCSGTGMNGPVTVSCGQSVCGTDGMSYSCSASGFSATGQSCGSACTCSGTGLNGPVTVDCGGSVCGTDGMAYSCSASGFSPTGQTCGSACTCSGTGLNGPVTVACGGSVCGTDGMAYSCSASGFSPTGQSCGSACTCSGTGLNGPATVNCGQTLCGTDSMIYSCSASGFSPTGQSCGAACTCSGTGANGPVTVDCGGTVCGTDSMTYSCSASGFSPTGQSCGTACTCTNGTDTVACGQTICGTDKMTYSCNSSGFSPTGQSCAPPCTCSTTGANGPVTLTCGESTCGTDGIGYVCTPNGFWYSGDTCGAEFCNDCPHGLVQVGSQCVDAVDPSNKCGGHGNCPLSSTTIWGCQGPGVCVKEICVAGFGDCDGVASNGCETPVDTATNCGACGHSCQAGEWCVDGACAPTCDPPHTACNSTTRVCANLATSVAHCGACTPSSPCDTRSSSRIPACSAGTCGGTCAPGFVLVGTTCTFATTACPTTNNAPTGGLAGCDGGTPFTVCHAPSVNCGGACVDTRIDAGNCGACGSKCSGACVNGTCQAEGADTLATIPAGQTARAWLGVDDVYVYAVAGTNLYAAPKDGSGALVQIAATSGTTTFLRAPGDGFLYWTDKLASGVYRVPGTGGAVTLVAAANNPLSLAYDDTYVYWDDNGTKSIRRAPRDGAGPSALVTSYPSAGVLRDIVVLGNNVYFSGSTDSINYSLYQAPKAGGTYTLDATEARTGGRLAIAGGDVYYGWSTGTVRRFAPATWEASASYDLAEVFGLDDSLALRWVLPAARRYFTCDALWYPLVDTPHAADGTYFYALHATPSGGTTIRRYPR